MISIRIQYNQIHAKSKPNKKPAYTPNLLVLKSENYPAANNTKKHQIKIFFLRKPYKPKKELNTKLPATTLRRVFTELFYPQIQQKKKKGERERDVSHCLRDRERSGLGFSWFNLGEMI